MKNRSSFVLGVFLIALLALPVLACSFSLGSQPSIMPTVTLWPTPQVEPVMLDLCSLVTADEAGVILGGAVDVQSYQETGGCVYSLQSTDLGTTKSLTVSVAQGEEAKTLTLAGLGMVAAFSSDPEIQSSYKTLTDQFPQLTVLEVMEQLIAILQKVGMKITPYANLGDAAYWMIYASESYAQGQLIVVKDDVYVSVSLVSSGADVAPDQIAPLVQTILGRLPAAFYVLPKETTPAAVEVTEEPTAIPQTPDETPTPSLTPVAPTSSGVVAATGTASPGPSRADFRVVVIVDTTSEPVSRQQAETVMTESSRILSGLTPFGLQMVDYVEDGNGGVTIEIASRYVESHPSSLPDGMVIFSFGDGGQAKLYGGYFMPFGGVPAGFRNRFVSPLLGSNNIYLAVIHFSHQYAACGYGDADSPQSAVSIDGECRNQPGTACVEHNGYSMCENAVNDLYASTPTYLAAADVIHEFMHAFHPDSVQTEYHYGSPECNAKMGLSPNYFNAEEALRYNVMCPLVYDIFANAYQP